MQIRTAVIKAKENLSDFLQNTNFCLFSFNLWSFKNLTSNQLTELHKFVSKECSWWRSFESSPFLQHFRLSRPAVFICFIVIFIYVPADGKPVDATQELIAIGLANIANSFVHAFPGAGALARSAVNNSSGVKTPLGGLYTGILVILALLFFTPFFYYIPKAALAAIIIAAVIFMVEVRVVKPMWRSKSKFQNISKITIFIFVFCVFQKVIYSWELPPLSLV